MISRRWKQISAHPSAKSLLTSNKNLLSHNFLQKQMDCCHLHNFWICAWEVSQIHTKAWIRSPQIIDNNLHCAWHMIICLKIYRKCTQELQDFAHISTMIKAKNGWNHIVQTNRCIKKQSHEPHGFIVLVHKLLLAHGLNIKKLSPKAFSLPTTS